MLCVVCGQAMSVFMDAWWLCHACGLTAQRHTVRSVELAPAPAAAPELREPAEHVTRPAA